MMSIRRVSRLVVCLAITLSLVACGFGTNQEPTLAPPQVSIETPFSNGDPTPLPTYTPTMAALGSPDNPITIGIINPTPETEQTDGLAQLASQLSGALQLSVEGKIYQDYMSLELALQKNELHFAWLQTPEYLLATQKDLVSSILGINSLGVSAYGIQYLAHRDAGLEEYFDVGSNTATSSPEHALQQFAGMRPCLTNSKSLAGYWVPLAYLAQSNISWEPPVETQSYNASLRALYIQGICAFTSTYAISADPRSSSAVINDLPDVIEKLPVIWISPPIIPNRALAASNRVDLSVQTRVSEFLLNYARNEAGRLVLSNALQYEVSALVAQNDSAFGTLRDLLSFTDIQLLDLVQ